MAKILKIEKIARFPPPNEHNENSHVLGLSGCSGFGIVLNGVYAAIGAMMGVRPVRWRHGARP